MTPARRGRPCRRRVTGSAGSANHSRGRRAPSSRSRAAARTSGRSSASVRTAPSTCPRRGCGDRDHHHLAGGGRAEHDLDVGRLDGGTADRHGVGPARDEQPAVREHRRGHRRWRSRPGRCAAGRRAVVPEAEVRRADPDLAVAHHDVDARERRAGPRRARPTRRTTAPRRRSSGAPRSPAAARRSCSRARSRSPATTTVRPAGGAVASSAAQRRGVSTAWLASAGVATRERPASSRGPPRTGSSSRPADRAATAATSRRAPAEPATVGKEPTHDAVVRTTDRGPARVPDVAQRHGHAVAVGAEERRDRVAGAAVTGRGRGQTAVVLRGAATAEQPGTPRARRGRRPRPAPPSPGRPG